MKLSVIFLWKRIFGLVRRFRVACWVMIAVVAAWSIAFFLATVFQCAQNGDWGLNWAPIGDFLTKCSDTLDMLTVFTVTDIVTDLIIISMPIPMVSSIVFWLVKKDSLAADMAASDGGPQEDCCQLHVPRGFLVSGREIRSLTRVEFVNLSQYYWCWDSKNVHLPCYILW